MRLPHFATRRVATLAVLSLVLAACSDSTAPDAPFDPAGTSADVAAAAEVFNSDAMASYDAIADEITAVVGGSPSAAVAVTPSNALSNRFSAAQFAKRLATNFSRSATRPNFATSSIPAEYAGKTFIYDPEVGHYVVSDRTGAPSNGVRFVLYEVDAEGVPTEPLAEIGYAQLSVTESGTSASARLTVVAGAITYFDYTVLLAVTSSTLTATIDGFVTNGTDRANFDFSVRVTGDAESGVATFKYALEIPTRSFRIAVEITFQAASETFTLKLEARGPHGRVTINGTLSGTTETYTVRVNGDPFATITEGGVTGADGEELTEDELNALEQVFGIFDGGQNFFDHLVDPTGIY